MSVSVIIPSLNEEKNIQDTVKSCIEASNDAGVDVELICIDDFSTDKTAEILEKLSKQYTQIVLVKNPRNLGFGGSFWRGVEVAKKDAVVVIPGDNENDLSQILTHYQLMNEFDMVVPYPVNKSKRTFLRRFISFLYLRIVNLSFRVSFRYTNGTVLYKTYLLKSLPLKLDSFMFQTANLILLSKQGARYKEVPYKLNESYKLQKSSALKFKTLHAVIKSYFKLASYLYFKK